MTPILGAATCSAEDARQWSRSKGAPDWWANLTDIYWEVSRRTGVRPDVGFAQASHETGHGWFGRAVTAMHHNPAGIKVVNPGADDSPDSHYRFPDWSTGITDHMHRLWRYATPANVPTPDGWTSVRPVPRHYWGTAPTVEGLSGKWAPSSTYHTSIVRNLEEMAMRRGFVIHHNGPPTGCVGKDHDRCLRFWDGVRRYHTQTKGWSDIAYSFGVCPHGEVFTGRGWAKAQWANGTDRVGVNDGGDSQWYTVLAFVGGGAHGGFDTGSPEERVTPLMEGGIAQLIAAGRRTGRCGSRVLPHNAFKPKACPGPTLTALAARLDGQQVAVATPAPPQEDDMGWTSLIHAAFDAKHPNGLTAAHKAKVWYWGDVLVGKAVRGDDPWGGYQWIKANEPDLK